MELISKQEIIDRLDNVIENGASDSNGLHPLSAEAVRDMVEKLPLVNNSEIPNSSDTISRQAAIEAIDNCGCDGEDSCCQPWIYKENAVEAIEMVEPLPSAQPVIVPCDYVKACNEATMDKLTSAVLYLDVLEELKKHGYVLVDMREVTE